MILITGAAGTIGSNLTYILANINVPIRAMVHNSKNIPTALRDLDIEIVEGDFEKPETLDAALKDIEKAFLVSPGDLKLVEHQTNFIEAAKRANIEHIVKISIIGAAPKALFSTGRWHFEAEQEIEASGIPFTHIRPHSFMQNFFMYASFIRKEGVFLAPMGQGRIPMIDARDIATASAVILTSEGHEGMIYELTGPETISYAQAAEVLSGIIGKDVKYIDMPLDKTRETMLEGGWPDWMVDDVISLYKFFRAGQAETVTDTVQLLTELPATTFERFVRDYAMVFRE